MTEFSKIKILQTSENDKICVNTCTGDSHSIFCPYTQERWKKQGLRVESQFEMPPTLRNRFNKESA